MGGGQEKCRYHSTEPAHPYRTVAQKGHTCKLKMLRNWKFYLQIKNLLQIKNRTCKLKVLHAN